MAIGKIYFLSIIKTLRFNFHYFGFKSIFKPMVLIARGVQFKCLKGEIAFDEHKLGTLCVGFPSLGTKNDSVTKGTINISGKVIIHGETHLAKGCSLDCGTNGVLEIGSLNVTGDTKIICKRNIKIGDNCLISWGGYIMDTDFHEIYQNGILINEDEPITIGNHCWIGMNCSILKGSSLPDNSIIAAGSTITKKLDKENCIFVNNKAVKEDVIWK